MTMIRSPYKILVLGGTRYFGKRLVRALARRSEVRLTVITRGLTALPSDATGVRFVRGDRSDPASLRRAVESAGGGQTWDAVVDQVCYSPSEAQSAIQIFSGKVGHWIHTSTQSVYSTDGEQREEHFDSARYPIPSRLLARESYDYAEGKRLAEAVWFQRAPFPVTAMRIPIVLGNDDYTGRLEVHIQRIRDGRNTVIPNRASVTSFISSEDAAKTLLGLLEKGPSLTGPINACSPDPVSIGQILDWISGVLDRTALTSPTGPDEDHSPLVAPVSRYMSCARAVREGFQFKRAAEWMPALIREICGRG